MRLHPVFVLVLVLCCCPPLIAQPTASLGLPFDTDETTGTVTVTFRHSVTWNRSSGRIAWKKLEAEIPKQLKFTVDPGSYDPRGGKSSDVAFHLNVQKGTVEGKYQSRDDKTWEMGIQARLDPRDARWGEPEIGMTGVAVDADLGIDTRLSDGPLPTIETLDLRKIEIGSIQAGPYSGQNISIAGNWTRPDWRLDRLEGDIFGGRIHLNGSGSWGTKLPPKVSINLEAEGLDLQMLLRAFNVSKADQVQARLSGSFQIEAEGREWKRMSIDVSNQETVYLDRQLIHDVLDFSIGSVNKEEAARLIKSVDEAINDSYGDVQMVPFHSLSLAGGLTPGSLNLRLPLHNEALKLDVEPRIDRELVWDAWDYLIEEGIKNIGVELKKEPKGGQDK